jgi:hypothetical protein
MNKEENEKEGEKAIKKGREKEREKGVTKIASKEREMLYKETEIEKEDKDELRERDNWKGGNRKRRRREVKGKRLRKRFRKRFRQ